MCLYLASKWKMCIFPLTNTIHNLVLILSLCLVSDSSISFRLYILCNKIQECACVEQTLTNYIEGGIQALSHRFTRLEGLLALKRSRNSTCDVTTLAEGKGRNIIINLYNVRKLEIWIYDFMAIVVYFSVLSESKAFSFSFSMHD